MFNIKKIIIGFIIFIGLANSCFAVHETHSINSKKKHAAKHHVDAKNKKILKKKVTKKVNHVTFSNKHPASKKKPIQATKKHILKTHSQKTLKPKSKNVTVSESTSQHYKKMFNLKNLNRQNSSKINFVASFEQRLVDFVKKTIATVRYSSYKFGGSHFDTRKGVYIVDCSAYIDHTLKVVYPNAYSSLVNSTGSGKPNSLNYYNFFRSLSDDSNDYWSKVDDVEQLQPGDILVFRYSSNRGHSTRGQGHVMVVMDKPVQTNNAYLVSVADSAPIGHSDDTRSRHVSGIGMGTLLLKVNPKTGQPSAYAWKIGSRWKNNVNFAMGRPIEIES